MAPSGQANTILRTGIWLGFCWSYYSVCLFVCFKAGLPSSLQGSSPYSMDSRGLLVVALIISLSRVGPISADIYGPKSKQTKLLESYET